MSVTISCVISAPPAFGVVIPLTHSELSCLSSKKLPGPFDVRSSGLHNLLDYSSRNFWEASNNDGEGTTLVITLSDETYSQWTSSGEYKVEMYTGRFDVGYSLNYGYSPTEVAISEVLDDSNVREVKTLDPGTDEGWMTLADEKDFGKPPRVIRMRVKSTPTKKEPGGGTGLFGGGSPAAFRLIGIRLISMPAVGQKESVSSDEKKEATIESEVPQSQAGLDKVEVKTIFASSNTTDSVTSANNSSGRFSHPGCAALRPLLRSTLFSAHQTHDCRACGGRYAQCLGSYGHRNVPGTSYPNAEWNSGPCVNAGDTPESPNRNYCSQLCEDHESGSRVGGLEVSSGGSFGQSQPSTQPTLEQIQPFFGQPQPSTKPILGPSTTALGGFGSSTTNFSSSASSAFSDFSSLIPIRPASGVAIPLPYSELSCLQTIESLSLHNLLDYTRNYWQASNNGGEGTTLVITLSDETYSQWTSSGEYKLEMYTSPFGMGYSPTEVAISEVCEDSNVREVKTLDPGTDEGWMTLADEKDFGKPPRVIRLRVKSTPKNKQAGFGGGFGSPLSFRLIGIRLISMVAVGQKESAKDSSLSLDDKKELSVSSDKKKEATTESELSSATVKAFGTRSEVPQIQAGLDKVGVETTSASSTDTADTATSAIRVSGRFTHPGCAALRPLLSSFSSLQCRACGGRYANCFGSYGHRIAPTSSSTFAVWNSGPCVNAGDTPESPNGNYCSQLCENHDRGSRVGGLEVSSGGIFGQLQPSTHPTFGQTQPLFGQSQPSTQPTFGQIQPFFGQSQPSTQPTFGQIQPFFGQSQPSTQPTFGQSQPFFGQTLSSTQPIFGQQTTTLGSVGKTTLNASYPTLGESSEPSVISALPAAGAIIPLSQAELSCLSLNASLSLHNLLDYSSRNFWLADNNGDQGTTLVITLSDETYSQWTSSGEYKLEMYTSRFDFGFSPTEVAISEVCEDSNLREVKTLDPGTDEGWMTLADEKDFGKPPRVIRLRVKSTPTKKEPGGGAGLFGGGSPAAFRLIGIRLISMPAVDQKESIMDSSLILDDKKELSVSSDEKKEATIESEVPQIQAAGLDKVEVKTVSASTTNTSDSVASATTSSGRFSHPGCAALRPLPPSTTLFSTNLTYECRACGGRYAQCFGSYGHRSVPDNSSALALWSSGPCVNAGDTPESPNGNYCSQLCENHSRGITVAKQEALSGESFGQSQPSTQPTFGQIQPFFGQSQPSTQPTFGQIQPFFGQSQLSTQPTFGQSQPFFGQSQPSTQSILGNSTNALGGFGSSTTDFSNSAFSALSSLIPIRPASGVAIPLPYSELSCLPKKESSGLHNLLDYTRNYWQASNNGGEGTTVVITLSDKTYSQWTSSGEYKLEMYTSPFGMGYSPTEVAISEVSDDSNVREVKTLDPGTDEGWMTLADEKDFGKPPRVIRLRVKSTPTNKQAGFGGGLGSPSAFRLTGIRLISMVAVGQKESVTVSSLSLHDKKELSVSSDKKKEVSKGDSFKDITTRFDDKEGMMSTGLSDEAEVLPSFKFTVRLMDILAAKERNLIDETEYQQLRCDIFDNFLSRGDHA